MLYRAHEIKLIGFSNLFIYMGGLNYGRVEGQQNFNAYIISCNFRSLQLSYFCDISETIQLYLNVQIADLIAIYRLTGSVETSPIKDLLVVTILFWSTRWNSIAYLISTIVLNPLSFSITIILKTYIIRCIRTTEAITLVGQINLLFLAGFI